jgi:signal transduction histidine kinase
VQRLTTTVGAILDLSRLEAGVGGFARERIDLPGLLGAVAREMEPVASDKGLILVVQVDVDLPAVRGDREKLGRVARNLIGNACKFSSRGEVVVAAVRQRDEIVISVSDEGCGILPENLERVFDRFFMEDPRNDGVGVGLSMCRTIIQAHGGRIWAESAGRGLGSTFRFALPVPSEDGATQSGQG